MPQSQPPAVQAPCWWGKPNGGKGRGGKVEDEKGRSSGCNVQGMQEGTVGAKGHRQEQRLAGR